MGLFSSFASMFDGSGADRTWKNRDGSIFYGYDDEDGKTDWYDSKGNLDSRTDTPDEDEQEMNDSGYYF